MLFKINQILKFPEYNINSILEIVIKQENLFKIIIRINNFKNFIKNDNFLIFYSNDLIDFMIKELNYFHYLLENFVYFKNISIFTNINLPFSKFKLEKIRNKQFIFAYEILCSKLNLSICINNIIFNDFKNIIEKLFLNYIVEKEFFENSIMNLKKIIIILYKFKKYISYDFYYFFLMYSDDYIEFNNFLLNFIIKILEINLISLLILKSLFVNKINEIKNIISIILKGKNKILKLIISIEKSNFDFDYNIIETLKIFQKFYNFFINYFILKEYEFYLSQPIEPEISFDQTIYNKTIIYEQIKIDLNFDEKVIENLNKDQPFLIHFTKYLNIFFSKKLKNELTMNEEMYNNIEEIQFNVEKKFINDIHENYKKKFLFKNIFKIKID